MINQKSKYWSACYHCKYSIITYGNYTHIGIKIHCAMGNDQSQGKQCKNRKIINKEYEAYITPEGGIFKAASEEAVRLAEI